MRKKSEKRDIRMALLAVTVDDALGAHGVSDAGRFIHNLNAKFLTTEQTGDVDTVLGAAWAEFSLVDASIEKQGELYIKHGGDFWFGGNIAGWAERAVAINRLLDDRLNVPDFARE